MPIALPRLLLSIALALATVPAASAAAPRPRLLVMISVDQFSLDLFRTYRPSFTGGLARLAAGRVFDGWQSHAATETCPGHSTLLTGDHPARTGIVANSWWDRGLGREVYCAGDDEAPSPTPGRTSARLKVDTLGDWMRRADPRAQVVSVAGKDRAAIMMAGHNPSAVYWWRDRMGFETSPGAGPANAAVLEPAAAFNRAAFAAWRADPPRLWPDAPAPTCAARALPLRAGVATLSGRLPPARPEVGAPDWEHGAAFAGQVRGATSLDELVLRFAGNQAEARRLGRGPGVDLLAVGLSATDSIGHRYGPGGVEMCMHLRALDAALGAFLQRLDTFAVPYVVALSADHGGIDAAERLSPPGLRIDVRALRTGLSQRLRERFALATDPLNDGEDVRQLWITPPPGREALRPQMVAEAVAWLRRRPEVAEVFTAQQIAATAPPRGKRAARLTSAERFRLSFDPARSGDLMVSFVPHATLGVPTRPDANVAGHGSLHDYDRRVPILFWGAGVRPGGAMRDMETVDIAPTLAAFARVAAPPVDGRCVELGQGCSARRR